MHYLGSYMVLDFGGTGKCESIKRTLWRPDDEYAILCRLLQVAGVFLGSSATGEMGLMDPNARLDCLV